MPQVETFGYVPQYAPRGARKANGSDHGGRLTRPLTLLGAATLVLFAASLGAVARHDDIAEAAQLLASPDWITAIASRHGPLVIVALMIVAVVVSPVPSGPIALAAGALYGALAGGCLAVAGASGGAMIAFALSRRFGYRTLRTSTHPAARWMVRPRSQNRMMLLVMVLRLVPFISFDAVSYCAGLTRLDPWRFAIATFLGVIPAAFAFAALGAGLAVDGGRIVPVVLACAITVFLPFGIWLRQLRSAPRSKAHVR